VGEGKDTSIGILQTPRGMTLAFVLSKWGAIQGYLETRLNDRREDDWVKLELPKLARVVGLRPPEVTEIREILHLNGDDIYGYLATRDIAYTVGNYYYYHLWALYHEESGIFIQPKIIRNMETGDFYVYTKIIPREFMREIIRLRGEDL